MASEPGRYALYRMFDVVGDPIVNEISDPVAYGEIVRELGQVMLVALASGAIDHGKPVTKGIKIATSTGVGVLSIGWSYEEGTDGDH